MNKEQLLKEIETSTQKLGELNRQLMEQENKEHEALEEIRKGKLDEIKKLEKVLGVKGSAPQPDTIRGLLAYQPDELENFTGVALTLILSALEQSAQATINALKLVD